MHMVVLGDAIILDVIDKRTISQNTWGSYQGMEIAASKCPQEVKIPFVDYSAKNMKDVYHKI